MILLSILTLLQASPAAPPSAEAADIIARNRTVVMKSYPPVSLKRGEEGTVGFRIQVNREGGIDGCQVTKSSGYAALDKGTCDLLLKGATAEPMTAANGWRVLGVRDGTVEWRLPEGARRPATPPPFTAETNANGEKLICRRSMETGSIARRTKVCLTAADWRRQIDAAQKETYDMQNASGQRPPG